MRRVITFIGFGFAIIFLVLIFSVSILFLLPNVSFGGARSVSLSDHYTRYEDAGVKAILAHRNIIIESSNLDVEIRSRKYNQSAAGTIVVFENATGISFNSLNRTLIDYLQYIDDDGEVWHKIVILEPEGAVSMRGYVYINLYANDEPELLPEEYRKPYNIVLNTRYSNVSIATDPDSSYLRVDSLTINNVGGTVNLPSVGRNNPLVVDLGKLTVNSGAKVNLNCRAPIRGPVSIDSSYGRYNMGEIGKEGEGESNVVIRGDRNYFNTYGGAVWGNVDAQGNDVMIDTGKVHGDVYYKANVGRAKITECRRMNAEVENADVNVSGKIDGGVNTDGVAELQFTATGRGACRVNQVIGVSRVKAVTGAVELRKVAGAVTIENPRGRVLVDFDPSLDINMQNAPVCEIDAWYETVTVNNIIGPTRITAPAGGRTRVYTSFRVIRGTNIIEMKGDTDARNRFHSVDVTLINVQGEDFPACNITVNKTSKARNNTELLDDNANIMTNGRTYFVGPGNASNTLTVHTDDWFELKAKTVKA